VKALICGAGIAGQERRATQGGTLHSGFLGRYTAINGAAQRIRLSPAVRHALGYVLGAAPAQRLIRKLMAVAIPRLPRMLPAPEPWMRRWAEYALSGERHEEASAWPTLEDIDIPVLIGSEWSMVGLHLFGAFEAWHRISAPKKMFIGPPHALVSRPTPLEAVVQDRSASSGDGCAVC
jgi:hypothetical protein